jgi:mono/diheme cytochrome c family protein
MNRAALAVALLAVTGAGALAAQEPALSAQQDQGRKLYQSTCLYCHGEKVWGTFTLQRRLGADHGLLEKRTDLVAPFVKNAVRNGLGSMPTYRRTELSDADVDAIAAYLTRPRTSTK